MKKQIPILLLLVMAGLAALFAADSPAPFEAGSTNTTNDTRTKVQAVLTWVVVTNWTPSNYTTQTLLGWIGDKDPNVTTHYESGWISSNLVAVIDWKGQEKSVLLESIPVGSISRSYILKTTTEKIYR